VQATTGARIHHVQVTGFSNVKGHHGMGFGRPRLTTTLTLPYRWPQADELGDSGAQFDAFRLVKLLGICACQLPGRCWRHAEMPGITRWPRKHGFGRFLTVRAYMKLYD
jgi:hypothetical protein